MRGAWIVGLLVASALAGCTGPSGPSGRSGPPGPSTLPTACRDGPGRFVIARDYDGGPLYSGYEPDLYTVDDDGDLLGFEGRSLEGSGRVRLAEDGEARNVSLAAVREELGEAGIYRPDRDYNVSLAYRARLRVGEADALCGLIRSVFYDLKARYDDPNCVDGGTFNVTVSTDRGNRSSSAYCRGGDADFERVRDRIVDLAETTRSRTGS